ncbi:hypothetical protein RWE15_17400 [Virgibacillus halophilus]|uniref:Uncharacterized protein n=1 Tax=Tigheibacillus halophilus TaxID=361280 RepID=A0ABU5C9D5_9BACI|nr:hypothetical protein [Virgibacillus halophilus]
MYKKKQSFQITLAERKDERLSTYDAFLEEKLQVDSLLKQGYTIIGLNGTLDGDVVEFEDKLRADKKNTAVNES